MGDPRRQRKTYSGPTHPWQKTRIDLESALKKKYGYKNKKELWKITSKLRNYRAQARSLIPKINTKQGQLELKQLYSKLLSYGLVSEKPTIDLNSIQNEELKLIGTLMYQKKDYYTAIKLVESGKLMLDPLITNHFLFEKYNDAYQFIERNKEKVMKVLIDVC